MRFVILRWALAAVSLATSIRLMVIALRLPEFGGAAYLVFSIAAFVTAIVMIAPETAFRLAEFCSRPFTNIFFPGDRFSKPPLSYKLARRYRAESRFDDASGEYEKIIRYYPKERDAYIELFDVAQKLGDEKLCRKYAAKFRRRFKEEPPAASV